MCGFYGFWYVNTSQDLVAELFKYRKIYFKKIFVKLNVW